jgi:hypothetical protein
VEAGVGVALVTAAALGAAAGDAGERLAGAGGAAAGAPAAAQSSPWESGGGGVLLLHARAAAACDAQVAWLGAAAGAAFLLAARALQLLALSPRVAVLGAAFSRAVGDVAHLGASFCALFFAFALVGHGAFGGSSERFETPSRAAFALLQMMVFDYDFDAMTGAGFDLAVAFFSLFMMLVTHALLWAGLGVVLETFALVRGEAGAGARGAPSLLQDARAGSAGVGAWARAACARWGPCRAPPPPPGERQPPPPLAPWAVRERRVKALERLLWALSAAPGEKGGGGGGGGGGAAAVPGPPPPTPEGAVGGSSYVTCAELAAALSVPVAVARRAAAAVAHGNDACEEYEDALAALVGGGEGGCAAAADAARDEGGWDAEQQVQQPPQPQKTIAVRGVLIRTAAPPPLELNAVSP